MSVRKSERGKTKLKVLTLCMRLGEYTAGKVGKDRLFPKSSRWMIPKRLMDECLDAIQCISFANSIFANNKMEASLRVCKEREAHGHLQTMLTLLDLAYNLYPTLDDRVMEYWVGLIVETDETLTDWMESDKKRFEELPLH